MTNWHPDSCACIVEFPEPFNERTAVLVKSCRTHRTAQETMVHNRLFSKESQIPQRRLERKKPEFQRR